ncbi:unnamed protein product [Ilex paraguariensis]|uniref:Uncharacterized protein n=1 Tax=Ilex paraguariensis TaxID=185542 RepID=A0ABC8TRQ0_9AQUA
MMSKARNNVEEQAAIHNLSADQSVLCLDKGKAVASVVLDSEMVDTNKKRDADNHLVPGNEIEGYPQVNSQVTEIIVKQVASPQQDTGRITSKNKFADLSLEGGELIVDLAAESQPCTSICNEVTKMTNAFCGTLRVMECTDSEGGSSRIWMTNVLCGTLRVMECTDSEGGSSKIWILRVVAMLRP